MKKIIVTVIVTLLVIAGGSFFYIESGSYDISQLTPHNAITKWVINTTRENSIQARCKDIVVPNLSDTGMIVLGFKHYNEMCSGCHGAPGVEQDEMARGLYPKPPKIYSSKNKPEANESFWIIKNGIKMTSMPAYAPTHSDDKIWAIVAFVTNKLGTISPEEYKQWQKKYAGGDDD